MILRATGHVQADEIAFAQQLVQLDSPRTAIVQFGVGSTGDVEDVHIEPESASRDRTGTW